MEGQTRSRATDYSHQRWKARYNPKHLFLNNINYFSFDERVRWKRVGMKTLQWIHSKIILKQKGPIYLDYSCLSPEGVRK